MPFALASETSDLAPRVESRHARHVGRCLTMTHTLLRMWRRGDGEKNVVAADVCGCRMQPIFSGQDGIPSKSIFTRRSQSNATF